MQNFIKTGLRELLRRHQISLGRSWANDIRALLDGGVIALLDVGASGGIIPRWQPFREDIAFTGIEPDERSIPSLLNSPEAKMFKSYEIIPAGAWSRNGPVGISFTRKPMCSSHFHPNVSFLSHFPEAERFDIVDSSEIQCQTINELLASSGKAIDFIKLDLEGGELAVLEGGESVLEFCMGLHVEASFQSIREGQPLFGDVAKFLQQRGIEFIDFISLIRWERNSFNGLGQAIFADALFLRGPESLLDLRSGSFLTPQRARSYLAILMIYERFDLALRFVDLLVQRNAVLSVSEIKKISTVLARRKASFERRYRFVSMFGRMFSRYAGQNYSLHYIY